MSSKEVSASVSSPYVELTRQAWAELAEHATFSLDEMTLERLRGLGDPTSLADVQEVYLPLTRLISKYIEHTGDLYRDSNNFLQLAVQRTPFVIAVAGSVAVGKSTTARLLAELLRGLPQQPRVSLVTTDGFLYPNDELQKRGLLDRKGFPESYDRRSLQRFVMDVKSGKPQVEAPVYSHLSYDIVPDQVITVDSPDILVLEGLNVLQPARPGGSNRPALALSDFLDFSVYVDAHYDDIRRWYVERFMNLRQTAFRDPQSFFRRFAELSDTEATTMANQVWDSINGPNLKENIEPTRGRATAILRKGKDHSVQWVRIRKI